MHWVIRLAASWHSPSTASRCARRWQRLPSMSLISLTTAVLTVLISGNFVFVSPDGSASPESFWSAGVRSVPFTLADQVVTGDDYRKLIRRRKASQENMTMCTPGLTAPSCTGEIALQRPGGRVKKNTDDVSTAFVACGVTLPLPVSSPFLNPGAVCFRGRSDRLSPIACRNFIAPHAVCIWVSHHDRGRPR